MQQEAAKAARRELCPKALRLRDNAGRLLLRRGPKGEPRLPLTLDPRKLKTAPNSRPFEKIAPRDGESPLPACRDSVTCLPPP